MLVCVDCVALCCRPTQVRWQLMVASCHRRSGNYQQALETYKNIHRKFPDNVECSLHLIVFFVLHCVIHKIGTLLYFCNNFFKC